MRVRRLRKEPAALEITAFINLVVVLVPFLLSTAVFSRLTVMDMSLPAQSSNQNEVLKAEDLKLEIVLRPDAIEVGDRIGGLIQRIEHVNGVPDTATLSTLMVSIKAKFPDKTDATVLAQPDTNYDTLVQVMDAVRATRHANGAKLAKTMELFPKLSIGDAPQAATNAPPNIAPVKSAQAKAAK
jgi:biopolymer transport protein ExbD